VSAKVDYVRAVAADWEDAGAPAPSDEQQKQLRERFAALDGPAAERAAYDLTNGIPSPIAYVVTWTERALTDATNVRRNAAMQERHRLQAEKRKRLVAELREAREAARLTIREMDGVLLGRRIYNVMAKPGFAANVEKATGSYSLDVVEAALEVYRGVAAARGVTVGPES
jgi:hypothetical protein